MTILASAMEGARPGSVDGNASEDGSDNPVLQALKAVDEESAERNRN